MVWYSIQIDNRLNVSFLFKTFFAWLVDRQVQQHVDIKRKFVCKEGIRVGIFVIKNGFSLKWNILLLSYRWQIANLIIHTSENAVKQQDNNII